MDEQELSALIDEILQRDDVKKMLDKVNRLEHMFVGKVLKENKLFSDKVTKDLVKKKLNASVV